MRNFWRCDETEILSAHFHQFRRDSAVLQHLHHHLEFQTHGLFESIQKGQNGSGFVFSNQMNVINGCQVFPQRFIPRRIDDVGIFARFFFKQTANIRQFVVDDIYDAIEGLFPDGGFRNKCIFFLFFLLFSLI